MFFPQTKLMIKLRIYIWAVAIAMLYGICHLGMAIVVVAPREYQIHSSLTFGAEWMERTCKRVSNWPHNCIHLNSFNPEIEVC